MKRNEGVEALEVLVGEWTIDHADVGLDRDCVINRDGRHTVAQSMLTTQVGEVGDATLARVCSGVSYALGG